ncbi:pentatricopeptide repeat-containing protein At4g21065-like [Abrus precatorius]|uniref:Pentatricopeptide repeat-containing protein At4g21065-like n=1 Tax=Abrus precatorius TaxID=3816 RepID=A0A8B8KJ42_ABRPR|nr:pentatricopeptide repeat-containing protein At4g21065-like [Abrus precatorius]
MGFPSDRYIGNTLLKMYVDCGAFLFARNVFDEMPVRDVVSWSSMIVASVASNSPLDALGVFREMNVVNEKPNSVTLLSLLSACTQMLNVNAGGSIHCYITRNWVEMGVALGTALFEMYGKCGKIDQALLVFNSMHEKNLQSCTIMISVLADHGRWKDCTCLFIQMEAMGLQLDSMSFTVILSACSHMGLVYEGKKYFDRMVRLYDIEPTVEHYGCMVDLLGRAGLIQEAYDIIQNMPMEPNDIIMRSFLSSCRNHGWIPSLEYNLLSKPNSELGPNYVLAANIFSIRDSWKDANDLRLAMKEKGLKKIPGFSWVEVPN